MKKKSLLLAILAILLACFFYFDLNQLLTLANLQEGLNDFEQWRAGKPVQAGVIFLLLYIALTTLSLPGAVVMTLAAGALFGLFWGTIIVSFASSIGATLAFLVSRYLLRDLVQIRFGERLTAINRGMEKDGPFYLFTLRLIPIFPFFLINLLMGLTTIRMITFYWVSQIGMLAGTLVYVNAGTQLAQLESLSGILSPSLLFSFLLIGIFPLLAKKMVDLMHSQRVYEKYQKPTHFDRNLIVIGAGAGGLVTSYIAAAVKAKVTLIEASKMGGDCLNYGCVPSKALIKTSRVAHQFRQAERYGLEGIEPKFSFKKVMARVQETIRKIEPHDSIERYEKLGVEVLQGLGRIVDPWTVEIQHFGGQIQRLTTRSIVLATGAEPFIPPIPGLEETGYVTSDTLWETLSEMDQPPKRLVILGGGAIGCELGQCFSRLGSKVSIVESDSRLMGREDEEISALVRKALQSEGIALMTNHHAVACEVKEGKKYLVVNHRGDRESIEYDLLLLAVGRSPRLQGYGLEELEIETDRKIVTNEYLETLYPNVYAVGDVVGRYQFTHTAAHQAWYASVNALFGQFKKFEVDYRVIPWTSFIDPELTRVGLNEQEAKAQGIPYQVTRYNLNELDRAITDSATTGFIKVLTVPEKDQILGVTIVGEHSGEIVAEFVLAMKHKLGLNKVLGTIHIYPTRAEMNKYVAGAWKQAHTPKAAMKWLEKYHTWRLQFTWLDKVMAWDLPKRVEQKLRALPSLFKLDKNPKPIPTDPPEES